MQFVNNDPAQVFKEIRPAGMVRQDAGVEHVGVADQEPDVLADSPAPGRVRIAIVCLDLHLILRAEHLKKFTQGTGLILR